MPKQSSQVLYFFNYNTVIDNVNNKASIGLQEVSQLLTKQVKLLIPVQTGATMNSLETNKITNLHFQLSTINHINDKGEGRYTLTTSRVVKNANKYLWFARTFEKNRTEYRRTMRRSMNVRGIFE